MPFTLEECHNIALFSGQAVWTGEEEEMMREIEEGELGGALHCKWKSRQRRRVVIMLCQLPPHSMMTPLDSNFSWTSSMDLTGKTKKLRRNYES